MIVDLDYIPKNWRKVKIPKVLFFQEGPGVRNWQFTDKGIKLLNVGNINNGKVDLNKTKIYLSEEEATSTYKHFLIDEGDLLIACSGIVVDNFHNKISFAEKEHLPLCLNTSTMRFKALSDEVDLNYFKYYLQTIHFTAQLRRLITGSAQLNFGPSHIKKIDLLLPPLETQKHIAQILDDAAALRDKTAQLIQEYDALAQSIFLDMFGDPVKNEKGWDKTNIGEVCLKVTDGEHGTVERVEKGRLYLMARNIRENFIDLNDVSYISEENHQKIYKRCNAEFGDILLVCVGATIGRLTITPKMEEFSLARSVALLKPNYEVINSYFLYNFLNSSKIQNIIKSSGNTSAQAGLYTGQIKKIHILLPPITLQNQFAEKIALIEQQKELAKQELKESEDLFNCLLQKAFKGELA